MFIEERALVFLDRASEHRSPSLRYVLPIRFIAYDAVEEWKKRRGEERKSLDLHLARICPLISKLRGAENFNNILGPILFLRIRESGLSNCGNAAEQLLLPARHPQERGKEEKEGTCFSQMVPKLRQEL